MQQQQFLDVIDRDEAEHRFHAVLDLTPLEAESIPLTALLGRTLAGDVVAPVDVPNFDRSNVDGFAVAAQSTFGCSEEEPVTLQILGDALPPGQIPDGTEVLPQTVLPIATGAVIPRGADAVVMVEHTESEGGSVIIRRPVTPGENVTFAGTDLGRGETVLRRGTLISSRETGVIAALGLPEVEVVRRPRVAILSTGDELIAPGATMKPGLVYDSNAHILADAVRELGGEPILGGIIPDDKGQLKEALQKLLTATDAILLSGGTSKGAGDVSYRVINDLGTPGIVAHGVALKPGKPLCLAAIQRDGQRPIPIAILPGFPTSAIFTFRDLVAPVIRRMAGRADEKDTTLEARLPMRINSQRGRTEYVLVGLVQDAVSGLSAYPMGKGSGSVTTFSRADGFVIVLRQQEYLEADERVEVHLLSEHLQLADLIVIGSHCVGLDYLLGQLQGQGWTSKMLAVGSTGGLTAAKRGECDVAGVHLFDPKTQTYNEPWLTDDLRLVKGYGRMQGVAHRLGDERFEGKALDEVLSSVVTDTSVVMVNRNLGSGTRVLVDQMLKSARPSGYWTEARSHNAVAAAVAQHRADWGVAIAPVAEMSGLGFIPMQQEEFDFVIPAARWDKPAVRAFRELLQQAAIRQELGQFGFLTDQSTTA